jgi:dTDP-4-dehydrorhamnose 3,5-epimerase
MDLIAGIILTPLKIIRGDSGNVMHAMKKNEESFAGFGEAYFSTVQQGAGKGWKCHREMILNIVVPEGSICIVLYDDRPGSSTRGMINEIILSQDNYQRLTVPPGIWMGFKGMSSGTNLLLNMASILHDPAEADSLPLINDHIPYKGFHS